MKAFVAAVAALAIISTGAWYTLTHVVDRSAQSVFSSPSTRF